MHHITGEWHDDKLTRAFPRSFTLCKIHTLVRSKGAPVDLLGAVLLDRYDRHNDAEIPTVNSLTELAEKVVALR